MCVGPHPHRAAAGTSEPVPSVLDAGVDLHGLDIALSLAVRLLLQRAAADNTEDDMTEPPQAQNYKPLDHHITTTLPLGLVHHHARDNEEEEDNSEFMVEGEKTTAGEKNSSGSRNSRNSGAKQGAAEAGGVCYLSACQSPVLLPLRKTCERSFQK